MSSFQISDNTTSCYEEADLCYDIIIVGGGVAGLSAALYSARDGFKVLVLEGEAVSSVDLPGGALMLTSSIENFPGFMNGEGSELISVIRTQAESFGATFSDERAAAVELSPKLGHLHRIHSTEDKTYKTKTVILATGAVARKLGVAGEDEFYGQGVSTCATCDGFFYRDKTVAVVGGGDTAIEDTLFLTRYAKKIYLIHRSESFRATGPELREVLANEKVEILLNSNVTSIEGGQTGVSGIQIAQKDKESAEIKIRTLEIDGIFTAIGRDPATGFLQNSGVEVSENGYILTLNEGVKVPGFSGVFAAGDAVDERYRQAITSAGQGVKASMEARFYLMSPETRRVD